MRNNIAFQRILAYINENNITKAQIQAATDQQILNIMYPPSGIKPVDNHATPELVKRCLWIEYQNRKEALRKQNIIDLLEANLGIDIESVEIQGNRQYLITLGEN